jgi:hypothetical protein
MQSTTRSILQELESLYKDRDKKLMIENRAANVIESAIRVIEQIEQEYDAPTAEVLTRKLVNAIKTKDSKKFARSVRRTNADS